MNDIKNLFTQVQSIRHRVTSKKLDQLDMKINLLTANAIKSTSMHISAYNYSKTRLSVAPGHCNDSMSFLSYGYISYIYITSDDLEKQV